jgi:hypothetical protein
MLQESYVGRCHSNFLVAVSVLVGSSGFWSHLVASGGFWGFWWVPVSSVGLVASGGFWCVLVGTGEF